MEKLHLYWVLCKSIVRTARQLMYGVYRVSQLEVPIITVFGGSRTRQDSEFGRKAHQLAHMLISKKISVLTGGGSGIMQAANCGASDQMRKELKLRNLGITVKGLEVQERANICVQETIQMDYFFARKWLLINFSSAFVFFPGGVGTLDEFFELLTLIETKKLTPLPIILFGSVYWKSLVEWLQKEPLRSGLLEQHDISMLHVTDDINEVVRLLQEHCAECETGAHDL